MVILRCTRKLLVKLGVQLANAEAVRSTTRLGDWYADILISARQHVLLCVSEHARVPVVISARQLKTFPSRLPKALALVLTELAVPADSIARELAEMQSAHFAKTASRSLLGTMNDYALPVTWALGGLVRQGQPGRFENTVRRALERAAWCSSDPVCIESNGQGSDSANLAACHGCCLLPETSCEEGNRLLDRALLVGTPDDRSFRVTLPVCWAERLRAC